MTLLGSFRSSVLWVNFCSLGFFKIHSYWLDAKVQIYS